MLKKYPHSSGDKRRAILRWGTKMVVSTSKPPPCTPNQQAIANYNKFIANYSKLYPGGPIPQNMAKTFDGPPTLERSGSEHRVGRFTSFLLRRKAWLEVELSLQERRRGRKTPFFNSKKKTPFS